MKRILCAATLSLCAVALAEEAGWPAREGPPKRVDLFPRLRAGEVFRYKIVSRAVTSANAQSVIVDPTAQGRSDVTVEALLRMEVLSVQPQGTRATIRLRTTWEQLGSSTQAGVPAPAEGANEMQRGSLEGKSIEFTLRPDGKVSDVSGLDSFLPEQQKAWRDWASQVSLASAYPDKGVQRGQKWKNMEAAEEPAAVKGLIWRRESAYVRDEPCRAMQLTLQGPAEGNGEPETCAVLLTTARLEQKSSPKDATPEEYRRHDLRTSGRVQGTSETISYVSLTSGLVVRITETGQQSLDITIAKADGSNKVHYKAEAKSRSQYLLVLESPLTRP